MRLTTVKLALVAICISSLFAACNPNSITNHTPVSIGLEDEAAPHSHALTKLWETDTVFNNPESVIYDPTNAVLFVSNINGHPNEKDGNGFIAKMDTTGIILSKHWVGGLNAPKGMGIMNGHLYVADLNQVAKIDLAKAKVVQRFSADSTQLLNDIAIADDGTLYVSDLKNGNIYQLKEGVLERWIDTPLLQQSNGLVINGQHIIIGTKNAIMQVCMQSEEIDTLIANTGTIDGLKAIGDGCYLGTHTNGRMLVLHPQLEQSVLFNTSADKVFATDFEYMPASGLLLVPTLFNNRVMAYRLGKGKTTKYSHIQGFAQGTTYSMVYKGEIESLQERVDSLLNAFNNSLSTYIPNSIISRINQNDSSVRLDKLASEVFEQSIEVYEKTQGAFDITVAPVVQFWGFGEKAVATHEEYKIDSLLQYVGSNMLKINGDILTKKLPNISLTCNAIAQGYSVEVVAGLFDRLGITDYMIEIGGELTTKGLNPKGTAWRIGIDKPIENSTAQDRQLEIILQLTGKALATSGNYRKFYEKDGQKFSHTIDPKTGRPVQHNLLSATIVCNNCSYADAYATACMVMGLDKSMQLLQSLAGYEAFFIYADSDGKYQTKATSGFDQYIYKKL